MNRFILKNTFIKIYIYHFLINIFIKNKKSKLCFRDRVIIKTTSFINLVAVPINQACKLKVNE
jgi:hypothetical protein